MEVVCAESRVRFAVGRRALPMSIRMPCMGGEACNYAVGRGFWAKSGLLEGRGESARSPV